MRSVLVCALALLLPTGWAATPPKVWHDCTKVHIKPRPCSASTNVPRGTSIYFEVTVPTTNPDEEKVDPDSVTATLTWPGGGPVTMLGPNQQWAPGYSGKTIPSFTDGTRTGYGFFTQPDLPLLTSTAYTVKVSARTLAGTMIDPSGSSWTFTTRRDLAGATLAFDVDLSAPTLTWQGRFFAGMIKPNFDSSRDWNQEPVYQMIDAARADAPEFYLQQRDWPLFADYWNSPYFDGNPNLVRERETRRITGMRDIGGITVLTVTDLLEGPLYGIPPGRTLSLDYHAGDQVLVCDRYKSEVATVQSVDDLGRRVNVNLLVNPAESWVLDYSGSRPGDNPNTPDNFSYPLGALRKFRPAGTPVYYWARLDDEWDQHVAHGRRPIVNVEAVSLDLCRIGRSNGEYGGSCPDLPKDWLEWHTVLRALIDHIVNRYGPQVADWYYSVGNEPNLSAFWFGTDDEYLAFHDYTSNALLHALEQRGIDMDRVRIVGPEAAGAASPVTYLEQLLYHASPTADFPGGGFDEHNRVCIDPAFDNLRSSRVDATCRAHDNRGSPLDVVSVHCYKRAAESANSMIDIRRASLQIDAVTFERLAINSHETTPDWVPTRDPGGREMYRWGGYFSTWGGEFYRRMLDEGMTDPRKRAGEITLTGWPGNGNVNGTPSSAGQLNIDEDGDGTRDRVDAVPIPFFHFAHLAATMSHELAPLGTQQDAGVTVSGWRSVEPAADKFLLYAHDVYDTSSAERGGWDVTLRLRSMRFPVVEVVEYRLDNDHPARAALAALPDRGSNGVYAPEEVAAFVDAARLRPLGPPARYTAMDGALEVPTRVLSGAVVFLDVRRPDPDGDGVYDPDDCAPLDPGAFTSPAEVGGVAWLDADTLRWDSALPGSGPDTVHDVFRETAAGDGVCVATGTAADQGDDPALPPTGAAFRYLVRARNTCGDGTWGRASDGSERVAACP
ncbi:MAG: hypothetical protein KBD01_15710 [Acidobacteria bacterium]|nr:hypothetical protein [Acidobacteriota bacterium]